MKWIIPQHKGVPLIEWLYSQRNISDSRKYFAPVLEDIEDPFLIHDMQKASEFILEAVKNKKKIFIHGDFDADGITATSIIWSFLYKELKADVIPYIPSRFHEGYGLTEESISAIKSKGGEVIISVDCGVKDIELVNKYSSEIDFVITDHHTIRSSSETPIGGGKQVGNFLISSKAKAVVHPALLESSFSEICGAMVAFKLCCALNATAGLSVDMLKYSDLCAIGTVCDVMPLVGENRTIVQLGINQINQNTNLGLEELRKSAGILDKKVNAYHIGFVIGPRLNAAGRLGDALDAVRLLTSQSRMFAMQLAAKLEALNSERKSLTDKYLSIAEDEIQKRSDSPVFVYFGKDWPEGILGLIAGKLSEKYAKPVIIGSDSHIIKASARSPENFHVTDFIKNFEEHLEKFGGHAQAAGLTVKSDKLNSFVDAVLNSDNSITDKDFEKLLQLDASLEDLSDLNLENAEELMQLEPFGNKNPKPAIYLNNVKIKKYSFMGKNNEHIKLFLTDNSDRVIEAIHFGNANKYADLLNYSTLPIEFAVTLELDEWNGFKKPTLRLIDFRTSK